MTPRTCTACRHDLDRHMEGEEGYARPCQKFGCGCTSFSDPQHDEAVKTLNLKPNQSPAGYCR